MKQYKPLIINQYKKQFKEDFAKKDLNKVIYLISNILGKRLGGHAYISEYSNLFSRGNENLEGFRGVIGKLGVRFNFKVNNTSGQMNSIDVWDLNKLTTNPSITIDTSQLNIVKAIDAITKAIQDGIPQELVYFEERVNPKTGGQISKGIADSINAWAEKMEIDEDKVAKTRISHLYNDFLFWHKEYGNIENFVLVSKASFYNYFVDYMKKYNIENIFARKIKVNKAGKEQIIVDAKAENDFNSTLYEMNLDDLMEQIGMAVVSVLKDFRIARLITGTAGIGKTRKVIETLKEMGYTENTDKWQAKGGGKKQYKIISGDIKNPRALFMLFTDFNDPNLILVFDDANSILKQKSNVELMRTATSNDKIRKLYYSDNKINDSNRKYKPELDFKSKIIIITNIPKDRIDNAITSRTSPIEIDASFQDIADSIRKNLNNIPPVEEMDKKLEVFDFIVYEAKKVISKIDYRLFQDCLLWRMTDSPIWKKFCYALLK